VSVQAQSIQQAASIVAGWHPDRELKVKFPIGPEDFFVEDTVARMGR